MKAAFATCLVAMFISATTLASSVSRGLAGTVVDTQFVPIPSARVVVYSEDDASAAVLRVDANGKFEIQLPIGKYDVMAVARGFAPVSKRIFVNTGISTFAPKLDADIEHGED